jgi:uncharacterized iron-regulated membrane protein
MTDAPIASSPPVSAAARPRRKRSIRALLFQIHLWSGLILCLPLVVIGLSGSYLVYHDEIEGLFADPAPAVSDGHRRSVGEIAAAALAAAPAGHEVKMLSLPTEGAAEPAVARVGPVGASFRDPRTRALSIDPATLAILGEAGSGGGGLTRTMHVLHGSLMVPGWGRTLVGWLGVVMVLLGGTGLVLWWPRSGALGAALTVKWRARAYRLNRDLHGSFGFWSLAVFLVVSLTGVALSFPQGFAAAIGASVRGGGGPGGSVVLADRAGAGPLLDLGVLAERAEAALPDATLVSVMAPFRPGQGVTARFTLPEAWEGAPLAVATLDPVDGRVLSLRDPREQGLADRVHGWQRPLHEGGGLGPVWRFLVFLSGLSPLLFSVTGTTMWVLRRRKRATTRAARR